MTVFEEVGLEALLTFGPILASLALAGLAWIVKWARRERKMWKEAWDED